MLRILKFSLLIYFLSTNISFSNEYIEPSLDDIEKSINNIKSSMEEANTKKIKTNINNSINKEIVDMESIKNNSLKDNFYNLDFSKNKNKYLSKTLAASKTINKVNGKMTNTVRPYVLISFSMPKNEIESLILEANKIGAIVSVRGFINNSFEETIIKLKEIAKQNIGGVTIDPTLFTRFNVDVVPTFILPISDFPVCEKSGCLPPDYIKATGSSSIKYFLNLVSNNNSIYSVIANEYLSKY